MLNEVQGSLGQNSANRVVGSGSNAPAVSVVIPAYNAQDFLAEAIESALGQSVSPLEVLCVDDGSHDATVEIAKGYGVQVIKQQNGGPAKARNAGLAAANGEWIAFLDADDVWLPEKLERQLGLVNESVGLVYTDRVNFGDTAGVGERQSDSVTLHSGRVLEPLLIRGNFITLSSVLVRRDLIAKVGGFDTNRELMRCEDWDLWLRLAPLTQFAACGDALVRYRRHSAGITKNTRAVELAHRRVIERAISQEGASLPTGKKREAQLNATRTSAFFAHVAGDYRFAAELYLKALALKPTDVATWKQLAKCLLRRR